MKKIRNTFGLDIPVNVLSGMNIDLKTKRKLQKEAKKWLKYIKIHSKIHDPDDMNYHIGQINFIKLFFFSKSKSKNEKNEKRNN